MMRTLLLLSLLLAAPTSAQARGFVDALHYDVPSVRPGQRGAPAFEHRDYSLSVTLDGDEGLEVEIAFDLYASRAALPTWVPVAVIDRAAGDRCEVGQGDVEARLQPPPPGFDHLGEPALCAVGPLPPRTTHLEASVIVTRPSASGFGDATALLLPVQPMFGDARSYHLLVEGPSEGAATVRPFGWSVEVASERVSRERWRWSVELSCIRGLVTQPGQVSMAGRAPAWLVSTVPSWDAASALHRKVFEAAAEPHGPVLALAGRVLGIRDPLAAVREAARIALGTIALEEDGGRGSLFQAPQPAEQTVEEGAGRAIDRAALLVSLLRTAELRAELVYLSPTAMEPDPAGPVLPLSRVLVLVPGISLEPSGAPLTIDPSRGLGWLGALDESLLGANALLVGPERARWLRLPSAPPLRRWAWSAAESKDGAFQVQVTGLLDGAPAARVRDWAAAGRSDPRPAALGFLVDLAPAESIELEETSTGHLQILFTGALSRGEVLARDGTLRVPALPEVALGPPGARYTQPRDAFRFDLEATESWTFRGLRSGSTPRTDARSTPFWTVDSAASWSGPVFNRRYRLRFTARELSALAAGDLEGFNEQVRTTLGGIRAPAAPR